jgi:hypothetical protein
MKDDAMGRQDAATGGGAKGDGRDVAVDSVGADAART